jgi:hypothetical protein
MMISRRTKLGCLMTLLVGFCLGIGFVIGVVAHQAWKKKTEEPAFMKWVVMMQMDKLDLAPEQRGRVEKRVDATVNELLTFRTDAMNQIWSLIERAGEEINADLTPAQQEKWRKIMPKRPADGR